ncbi:hypothetical protein FGK63_14290 [Ruegeria sediminis]|uniref:Uncharacterized protein n=1 Tax=Ruegeria sediminis TaxID=2583820 RepID=A0ABY2WUP9_9RHOB|nr:hypothetical protein [Ruegeria sediminis]TMV06324.1 hypothetical protein FGK63_14290 [Ruegeria sediminis]
MTPLFKNADSYEVRTITTDGGRYLLTTQGVARVILNYDQAVVLYGGHAVVELHDGNNVFELVPEEHTPVSIDIAKLEPVEGVA